MLLTTLVAAGGTYLFWNHINAFVESSEKTIQAHNRKIEANAYDMNMDTLERLEAMVEAKGKLITDDVIEKYMREHSKSPKRATK